MDWQGVGDWLKNNAGSGAALVGSLLTGNIPGAVAAGVSLVTSATGEANPDKVLAALQTEPGTVLKLRELAIQENDQIRQHVQAMEKLRLEDAQAEHHETQETIRAGDKAEDVFVRRTRPAQSWASLLASFAYVGWCEYAAKTASIEVLMALLALPWAYAGLRQVGKWGDTKAAIAVTTAKPVR